MEMYASHRIQSQSVRRKQQRPGSHVSADEANIGIVDILYVRLVRESDEELASQDVLEHH